MVRCAEPSCGVGRTGCAMPLLSRLWTKLQWLASGSQADRNGYNLAQAAERGKSQCPSAYHRAGFEKDYNSASALLEQRMDAKFPGSFHDKLGSGPNNAYAHGEKRSDTVDDASVAIAQALRNGATVEEAAEAGAAKIGV